MDNTEGATESDDSLTLYCIDCGQMLDRRDERCFSCGAYQ